MIRWVTPVKEFMRTATEDRVVGDVTVAAGDSVYLAYLSANRDEDVFEDPFRFDVPGLTTSRSRSATACTSASVPTSLVSSCASSSRSSSRVDDLRLAGEPSRSATVFVGGLKHLPVSYRMR